MCMVFEVRYDASIRFFAAAYALAATLHDIEAKIRHKDE